MSTETGPRVLVIGAGSIGRRHSKNLKELGAEVLINDTNIALMEKVACEGGFQAITDIDKTLAREDLDGALICTPNNHHLTFARKTIEAGLDTFIEKPLSHSYDGVQELIDLVKSNGVKVMCGFNMRYEAGLVKLKQLLNPQAVAFATIESGSFLPEWRKGTDYRNTYSAHRDQGGGIILDGIHELDYACWLFGYPQDIMCSCGRFSNQEIDVEDTAHMNLVYKDKLVSVHLDYVQRKYTRRAKVCNRDGYGMEWSFGDRVVSYTPEGEKTYSYRDSFDVNRMYVEEMSGFLRCLRFGERPSSDLENASRILQLALKAREIGEAR